MEFLSFCITTRYTWKPSDDFKRGLSLESVRFYCATYEDFQRFTVRSRPKQRLVGFPLQAAHLLTTNLKRCCSEHPSPAFANINRKVYLTEPILRLVCKSLRARLAPHSNPTEGLTSDLPHLSSPPSRLDTLSTPKPRADR